MSSDHAKPEDAVLVLDLQLFADHPDEQLAALDDPRGGAPEPSCGAGRRVRLAGGARHTSSGGADMATHVTPLGQLQPGSDGPVIRRRLGQHLARRATRCRRARARDRSDCAGARAGYVRPRTGALPAAHQQPDRRAPEVEVAREDLRAARRRARAAASAGAAAARASTPSTTMCNPIISTGVPSIVDRAARARDAGPAGRRDTSPSGSRGDRAPGSASTPRAPTCPSRGTRVAIAVAPARPELERHELDGLDVVAVVAQRVEHARRRRRRATTRARRRGRRRSRGRSRATSKRTPWNRPKRPTPQCALNAATGEVAMPSVRCRCAGRAARGGTSGRRGRSRSSSRA